MKFTGILILICASLILIISCVERIDVALDESHIRLIVDGTFTTDTMSHRVVLSKTTSYYYNQEAPAVTGAFVQISDGDVTYDLVEEYPGTYRTDPDVFGLPGKSYILNIKLATGIGGQSEYSASSTLYPVSQLDSVSLAFHSDWSEQGVWEVKCFVQDPLTTDFYRFVVSRNGAVITDTLDEWFVTDDRFFNGNYAYGAPVAYMNQGKGDEELKKGDTVTLEMNSIGSDYANFIWDSQSEVRGSYPLFSGPPANVKGNLNNGAIGFFAAYSVSRSSVVVQENF